MDLEYLNRAIAAFRAEILAEAARFDALAPDASEAEVDAAMEYTPEHRECAFRLMQAIDSLGDAVAVHNALLALQAELEQTIPDHIEPLTVIDRLEGAEAEYRQQSDNPYYTTSNFAWFDVRVSHALTIYYRDNAKGRELFGLLAGHRDGDCRTGLTYKVTTRGSPLTQTPEGYTPNMDASIAVVTFPNDLPIVEIKRW